MLSRRAFAGGLAGRIFTVAGAGTVVSPALLEDAAEVTAAAFYPENLYRVAGERINLVGLA